MVLFIGVTGCKKNDTEISGKGSGTLTKTAREIQSPDVEWKDGVIERGAGRLDSFLRNTELGIRDELLIQETFVNDDDSGTDTYYIDLIYDGKTIRVVGGDSLGECLAAKESEVPDYNQYKYLIKRTGRGAGSENREDDINYFLVDDNRLTADEIFKSQISNSSDDFLHVRILLMLYK